MSAFIDIVANVIIFVDLFIFAFCISALKVQEIVKMTNFVLPRLQKSYNYMKTHYMTKQSIHDQKKISLKIQSVNKTKIILSLTLSLEFWFSFPRIRF